MRCFFFIVLLFLISCKPEIDSIYGTWEIGEKTGMSTVIIEPRNMISWIVQDFKVIDRQAFAKLEDDNKITLSGGSEEDCFRLTFEFESDDQAIFSNYKCYIHDNMIDEIALAKRNGSVDSELSIPQKEVIILPNEFSGEFFIVYSIEKNSHCDTIKINDRGIGYCFRKPDCRQLLRPNRVFQFDQSDINTEMRKISVIQKGMNQSSRQQWNKSYGLDMAHYVNIEYFSID